jgi:hypothetical protein
LSRVKLANIPHGNELKFLARQGSIEQAKDEECVNARCGWKVLIKGYRAKYCVRDTRRAQVLLDREFTFEFRDTGIALCAIHRAKDKKLEIRLLGGIDESLCLLDLCFSTSFTILLENMLANQRSELCTYISDMKSGRAAFQGSNERRFFCKGAFGEFDAFGSQGFRRRRFRVASKRPNGDLVASQQILDNTTTLPTRRSSDQNLASLHHSCTLC